MDIGHLLPATGVFTWAAVIGFSIYIAATHDHTWAPALGVALVNLGAMWVTMGGGHWTSGARFTALWIQLASAFGVAFFLPYSFLAIYTIIWLTMAASYYSLRTTMFLLGGVLLGWYLLMKFWHGEDNVVFTVVLWGTFHLFALITARNAHEADEARSQVEALNRELLATQHLLAEASRQSERTRIARDLHDLLGHHLTALTLNLQIAEHLSSGEVKKKVGESRALARLLLSDVREAVSTLRTEAAVDFRRAITLLVDSAPGLDVTLDIEDGLEIDDVEIAETLLRCVQESITNTLRHSGASRSWIRVWRDDDRLLLEVGDNGTLDGALTEGNGLTGMRERLDRIRGSLTLNRVEKALAVHVEIPLAS